MAKKVTKKSVTADAVPAVDPVPTTAATKVVKPRATSVPRAAKVATEGAAVPVTDHMIAERAYHLWRNGEPGDHHSHWLSAERELRDGR